MKKHIGFILLILPIILIGLTLVSIEKNANNNTSETFFSIAILVALLLSPLGTILQYPKFSLKKLLYYLPSLIYIILYYAEKLLSPPEINCIISGPGGPSSCPTTLSQPAYFPILFEAIDTISLLAGIIIIFNIPWGIYLYLKNNKTK